MLRNVLKLAADDSLGWSRSCVIACKTHLCKVQVVYEMAVTSYGTVVLGCMKLKTGYRGRIDFLFFKSRLGYNKIKIFEVKHFIWKL